MQFTRGPIVVPQGAQSFFIAVNNSQTMPEGVKLVEGRLRGLVA